MSSAPSAATARKITRFWPLISSCVAVLLVAALGAIIAFRDGNLPFAFDTVWMKEVIEHRSPAWDVPALVMNVIGGGLIGALLVPIAITVTFCVLRRWSAALYFLLATVVSAGLVQLLKNVYDRPRPIDILVTSDLGSFPSGHVANAATMAVVLGVILQRKWVWVVGVIYAIAMMISRTYLGAHWLSDTIGGLVLGAAVGFGFAAPFAHRLHVERPKAAPGNAQPKG